MIAREDEKEKRLSIYFL